MRQRLLIEGTPQGERLARLLVAGEPAREQGCFVVPHDDDVDGRILSLVDMLTTIRWAHPTFTQLELLLPKKGGAT